MRMVGGLKMQFSPNIQENTWGAKSKRRVAVDIVIAVLLALIPITLCTVMMFLKISLSGLITFFVGSAIGLTIIPFMLFITKGEEWAKKWYVWLGIILTIIIIFTLPILKDNAEYSQMQGAGGMGVNVEKPMY